MTVTSAPPSANSVQMTATAQFSDGSTRDVTIQAQWSSSNTSIATVSATGVLSIIAAGDVDVSATYQGVTGRTHVSLTRAQHYTVSGVAHEVSPGSHPIAGAQVKITDGPDTGMTATTDTQGRFQLAGVTAAAIGLEATKNGFIAWKVSNFGIDSDKQLDVSLYPVPPTNASGKTATARCKDGTWSWDEKFDTACKDNGGVAYMVCPGPFCGLLTK
jgi:hypothetical protein